MKRWIIDQYGLIWILKSLYLLKQDLVKGVENIDDIISGLFFLQGLTKFIYVTRDSYSFKKGKNENSNRRK